MNKFRKLIAGALLLALCLSLFAACAPAAEFTFATDLEDGRVQADAAYSFRLSILYGDEPVTPEVTCNGILLTAAENHTYTAPLRDGENEIEFSAQQGKDRIARTYRVTRRAEFTFPALSEDWRIEDDRISFAAGAAFNGEPCALTVLHNGSVLSPEGGVYTAELSAGDNTLTMIARAGDFTETKEWRISYDGFVFVTNLENADTANPRLDFRAMARYGENACGLNVTVNGAAVASDGMRYTMTLQPGENRIVLTASHNNAAKQYAYTVRYVDAAPTVTANITDGKTYKSSTYSFDVKAKDGLGQKLSASAVSFFADFDADDGAENFAPVSGVALVWDDSEMTSYRIRFKTGAFAAHTGAPFLLKIVATDDYGRSSAVTYRMTADPVGAGEQIGEVVFSMEGFSIECGYFIAPVYVPVYEGVPFSETLIGILEERGWTYSYTGRVESGFYLASVGGLNLEGNRIADGVWEFVKDSGYTRSVQAGGTLGEFDFGSGSGWMYSVNGVYKNYGLADYYPQDGDAVRVQFTVILGEDLGGGGALGGGSSGSLLNDNPDYAPIMRMLAEVARGGADRTVYREVLAAVSVWNLSQNEMERQTEKLKAAYGVTE